MSAHLSGRWPAIRGAVILAVIVLACSDSGTPSGINAPQLTRAADVGAAGEPTAAAGDTAQACRSAPIIRR
jgi:hypothetical protein